MNKWIIGIVAVLLFVTPAMAVIITAAPDPENPCKIIVEYTKEAEEDIIRAFGLDLEVNECNCIFLRIEDMSPDYWVYPGQIVIGDGEVDDQGTPDANGNDFPGTLPGLGTQGVTIEMGSLYAANDPCHPEPPAPTGILFSFVVDQNCVVAISENEARGGIVLEDASNASSNLPILVAIEDCNTCGPCFPEGHDDYDEWLAVGQLLGMRPGYGPKCWCYPRQCHGDADGRKEGTPKSGYSYCWAGDLTVMLAAWKVLEPANPPTPSGPGIVSVPGGICADFAHNKEGTPKSGYARVWASDLTILLNNWKVLEPANPPTPSGPGIPPDCGGTVEP